MTGAALPPVEGRIVDLTLTLVNGMRTWDVKPPFTCLPYMTAKSFALGFNSKLLVMEDHTGTHVDAPLHFYDGEYRSPAGPTVAELPLDRFCGPGVVIDCADKDTLTPIDAAMLAERADRQGVEVRAGDVVLVRTWPGEWGTPMDRFLATRALTRDACEWLVERGIRAVGVDHPNLEGALSAEYDNLRAPGHELLLHPDAYVPIFENLVDLHLLAGTRFSFAAFPLKIAEGTGSPVRAVAFVEE